MPVGELDVGGFVSPLLLGFGVDVGLGEGLTVGVGVGLVGL